MFYFLACLFTVTALAALFSKECSAKNEDAPFVYIVKEGDTLSEIASRFSIPVKTVRSLNNLFGNRIYAGQRLRLGPDSKPGINTYIVKKGDTLAGIARKYSLKPQDLIELNDLKSSVIHPGMRLKVTVDQAEEEVQFEYVVKKGDTLNAIARNFDVGLDFLIQLNRIKDKKIYPGQRLQLRPSSLDEAVHVVRSGETLTGIAQKYNIKISTLRELNGIKNDKIRIGDKLRIKGSKPGIHLVETGDALWEIALSYGMTVSEIKELNGLTSDRIYAGQELKLQLDKSDDYDLYTVRPGDYLNNIARLHQMDLSELIRVNNLSRTLIHPGDILKVKPILGMGSEGLKEKGINWNSLINLQCSVKAIPAGNGPYYHSKPEASNQKHQKYFEVPAMSPLTSYNRARDLLDVLDRELKGMVRLSSDLKGWHFVLDPGHGGQDPGAIVKVDDGAGNTVFLVEDEYVYDMALRVYALLRLHSAEVTLTLLSPNHLIRTSSTPNMTFVNEKNEVYNSYEYNKRNKWEVWPSGGRDGNLHTRVEIAKSAFKGVPQNRRVFLSFHADIDPNMPAAPLVLYYMSRKSGRVDTESKKFANAMLPALGAGAYTRGQGLGVLRNNPAAVKVLLELKNLAYNDHAWALRFEELRHRDAEKVVKGILEYVRSKT